MAESEAKAEPAVALPGESSDVVPKAGEPSAGNTEPLPLEPVQPAKAAAPQNLPLLDAPKLDVSEPLAPILDVISKQPGAAGAAGEAGGLRAGAGPMQSLPFALLAASLATAAALGAVVGSFSASGFAQWHAAAANSAADANAAQSANAEFAELAAMKASLDGAARSSAAQFAKVTERLDRIERAQAEPMARLGRIAETVDRLDKRSHASGDVTGSIATNASTAAEGKTTDRILEGWVVRDVQNGRALVESRRAGLFEISTGSFLPGPGRVDAIKRQDGQWVVITARGMILSAR